jgi:glycosyltransferase involved in cell wall biosynthesis
MKKTPKAQWANPASPRVMFVSRVIPVENSTGARTYVIDLLKYLKRNGCHIELVMVDTSPGRRSPVFKISPEVYKLGRVSVRNNHRLGRFLFRYTSILDLILSPIGIIYYLIHSKKREKILELCYEIANLGSRLSKRDARNFSNLPFIDDTLANQEEIDFVNYRFNVFKPDVVLLNYVWLSPILDHLLDYHSSLKVIITHDVLHKRIESAKQFNISWTFSDWNRERESLQLRKADVLLSIHDEDTEIIKKMAPESDVLTIPLSVSRKEQKDEQVPGRCLFVGSNGHANVHGLTWFLDHVWPIILSTVPHCSMHICGTVCHEIKHKYQNVNFLGRVDALETEYSASELIVIPLIFGSGLKIKLVEALSHGRACVSTSVGVQGLKEFIGKAVLVDDTIDGFAKSVKMVLTDRVKREMMESYGRKHIVELFNPDKIYRPFLERIFSYTSETRSV